MMNCAFFDVDGTLLNIKTMFSFQRYFFLSCFKKKEFKYILKYYFSIGCMKYYFFSGKSREFINKKFYESFAGIDRDKVATYAYEWYCQLKKNQTNLFIPETLGLLKDHQRSGDVVIFVSGSSMEILAPIAEDLGVNYILATNLEVINKKFTGKIIAPQTIGFGKKLKLVEFIKNTSDKIKSTYGYGDDDSDIHMLSATDFPTIIPGNILLEKYAHKKEWATISVGRSTSNTPRLI